MAAKFSVFKDKAGKYRFNIKAANGEVIAASESYPDKKSALKGIASVQKSAATAKISDDTGEADAVKKPGRKPVAVNAKTTVKAKTAATKAKEPVKAKTSAGKPKTPAKVKSAVNAALKPRGRKPKNA